MNSSLADPPVLADAEPLGAQTPGETPPGVLPESRGSAAAASKPSCANCGALLDTGQDWCLSCGAGAPGSLLSDAPTWRSAAAILTVAAVLVLGAGAAAYAALNKKGAAKAHPTVVTVAQVPAAVTPAPQTTPTPSTPGAATPTPKPLPPPTTLPPLSPGAGKPPKIPLTAPTPSSSGTSAPAPAKIKESNPTANTPSAGNKAGSPPANEPEPISIVLDPNAASTYDPYAYPASEFGDPSLAIDGDRSTRWTAAVNPAVAPKMAEGLSIDLKSPQRLAAVKLVTSTPGMSVQIFGANGHKLPTSITDPGWVPLSVYFVVRKRTDRIKLKKRGKAFRFVTIWISNAPAAALGTPGAPGHVSVNELELFPAR